MKEIFDRNRDRMTDAEDRRVWSALFDATRARTPLWKRWRVAAPVLATVTAAMVVVALVQQGPSDLARERVLADRAEMMTEEAKEQPATAATEMDETTDIDAAPRLEAPAPRTEALGAAEELAAVVSPEEGVSAGAEAAPEPGGGASLANEAQGVAAEVRTKALADSRRPEPTQADIARVDAQKLEAKPTESIPPPAPQRRAKVDMEAGVGVIQGRVTDEQGKPLYMAIIDVVGTSYGALADSTGAFAIDGLVPGKYTVRVEYLGRKTLEQQVQLVAGKLLALDARLEPLDRNEMMAQGIVPTLGESSASNRTDSDANRKLADTFAEAIRLKQKGEAEGRALHFRGGRSAEVKYDVGGIPVTEPLAGGAAGQEAGAAKRAKPLTRSLSAEETRATYAPADRPVSPVPGRPTPGEDWGISVGGTDPVNGQAFDAMFFEHYGVNPFVDPQEDRFATFAMDVDNASFAMARSYLLRGELPPKEAIRVEEFINSFRHDYAPPSNLRADRLPRFGESEHGTFAIHLDAAPSPFGKDLVLMRVGLKGREIDLRDRKPAVLTFVIDVSGSMGREDRLELVKRSLYLLLDQMNDQDEVGLVVYGSTARVILPHTSLRYRRDIERAIASLMPEGATNAEDGLRQGYALADRGLRRDFINRVILCSDGVANVGQTGADGILAEIKREAGRGIEMTAVGFGMGNYNDVLMEKLADQGDGNYYYVDDIAEARKVFVENLTGTLQTIARQCKIQVEFDPGTVRRYRLIGYENRDVADVDFRNDKVDAGEVGAGHEVTALFEVKLEKDQRSNDMATVRIRYEDPESGRVTEEARTLRRSDVARRLDDTDATFRMDAAVAEFSEILRHSYWAKGSDLASVVGLAKSAARDLGPREDLDELVGLAETAWRLWPQDEGPTWREDVHPAWEPENDYRERRQKD